MASTTSPDGITYPDASDPIAPLNAVFQDLAESVQDALDDIRDEIIEANSELVETGEKSADYTLALVDAGKVVAMNKTGAATLTVPANADILFPIGTLLYVYNMSSDNVTISGAGGVTVRNAGTVAQYAQKALRKRDTNEWVVF
jgi:hypothetical protein